MGAILGLIIPVLLIASMWKLFEMAGKPGWAAIVPIYNIIIMLEIIKKPMIWLLYFIIPIVGIYFGILATIEFAKAYGKGTGFAVGLLFLSIVFFPILAFSKDTQYIGVPDQVQQ